MTPVPTALKTCTRCGLELPATSDFFYGHGHRHYLRSHCKECGRALTRAWAKANPEKKAVADRAYRLANLDSLAAKDRTRREANPEKTAARVRAWVQEHPEASKAHKNKWVREHPEERRTARKRWWDSRPEYGRQAHAVRRARQLGGHITKADYRAILAEYGMTCHLCGEPIEAMADLQFDHVVPLARGGQHAKANIRPSHARCNQRKGAALVKDEAERDVPASNDLVTAHRPSANRT